MLKNIYKVEWTGLGPTGLSGDSEEMKMLPHVWLQFFFGCVLFQDEFGEQEQ